MSSPDPFVPENDTLARIGTSCFQQLLENNTAKLSGSRWERVATTFVKLFRTTTPHQLFDETLRVEIDDSSPDLSDTTGNFRLFNSVDCLSRRIITRVEYSSDHTGSSFTSER
jgi:hypothetical protein